MVPPDALQEINRTLGTLIGKVDGLALDVSVSREESSTGRRRLYQRLEDNEAKAEKDTAELLERLDRLEKAQKVTADAAAATAAQLAGIQPTIDAFGRLKQRGIGAIAVLGFIFTLLGGAIVLKWDAIVAAFSRVLSPGS